MQRQNPQQQNPLPLQRKFCMTIKAIIGLGNPGHRFTYTRHNIGFRVIDAFADQLSASFKEQNNTETAHAAFNNQSLILIKPQTFMNSSGAVIPSLTKKGITAENIVVIHDELELPFGKISLKKGGSHKGHNGLKSLIAALRTPDFWRLRIGIGRPENREEVPDYVLEKFREPAAEIEQIIQEAVTQLEKALST